MEMVEWERNTYRKIGNVLIFKFSGILIAIHLVTILYSMYIACICIMITLHMKYGEVLQR